jgi:hypothetical protein
MLPAGGVEKRVDATGGRDLEGRVFSFWYFAWDPHRPGHARPTEARTTLRSAK